MVNKGLICILLAIVSLSITAQEVETIVVTGSKLDSYGAPAITLVKPADFLIQRVELINDSRNKNMRVDELHKTVKALLKTATKNKRIEIATGDEIVYPISLDNFQLDIYKGARPDTSLVKLLIKTPIQNNFKVENLINELNDFINSAHKHGRTEINMTGELILSIVDPQKHRKELLELIAKDIGDTLSIFGTQYTVQIDGISEALQWERSSVSDLRLFLEYEYTLIAK